MTGVVRRDDVWVVAQLAHRLPFSLDRGDALFGQSFVLDQGDGHVAVEVAVMCELHPLCGAFANKTLDLVVARSE